jgi:hypothetical protein
MAMRLTEQLGSYSRISSLFKERPLDRAVGGFESHQPGVLSPFALRSLLQELGFGCWAVEFGRAEWGGLELLVTRLPC